MNNNVKKYFLILTLISTFALGAGATENYDFPPLPDAEVGVSENYSDYAENTTNLTTPTEQEQQQELEPIAQEPEENDTIKNEETQTIQETTTNDSNTLRTQSLKRQFTVFGLIFACGICVLYLIGAIYKNYFVKEQVFDEKISVNDENSLMTPENVNMAIRQFLRKVK